jgi:glycerol uptake facilitator-like aquaporin
MMAMLNGEIPDGDVRKFTREDVELLVELAGLAMGSATSGYQNRARAIAQRIAALLPPEKAK